MRLGNILAQSGGVPETGRPVKFQIRTKQAGRSTRKWCEAMILPVSEDERGKLVGEARRYCDDHPEVSLDSEIALRQIQVMLYDPEDLRVKWAMGDELPALRAGLVADQAAWLLSQYRAHIESEYPELISKDEGQALENEAEKNS